MRRISRQPLAPSTLKDLERRQEKADRQRQTAVLDVEKTWRSARQTRHLKTVFNVLKSMSGKTERCMYCLDSHGTDIDHFWPKAPYPERLFVWPNLLLSCTECGRFKGNRFPLADGLPLLIDPTSDDPWLDLEFDPQTGNITARFDPQANDWSPRGMKTVEILQLDRREALAARYHQTFLRLSQRLSEQLGSQPPDANDLLASLREIDDHGLLEWCFFGTGERLSPFSDLCQRHPTVWQACQISLRPEQGHGSSEP